MEYVQINMLFQKKCLFRNLDTDRTLSMTSRSGYSSLLVKKKSQYLNVRRQYLRTMLTLYLRTYSSQEVLQQPIRSCLRCLDVRYVTCEFRSSNKNSALLNTETEQWYQCQSLMIQRSFS